MQRQNFEGRTLSDSHFSMNAGSTQRHWESFALIDHRSKFAPTVNSKFEFENEFYSGNFDVCFLFAWKQRKSSLRYFTNGDSC